MAKIHTDLPEHRGENRLAQQLVQILPGNAHIWFDIDSLPSVPEIDVLLAIPDVGCFCIEVKAIGINAIESFGLDHVKIEGRPRGPSPQRQAYRAALALRNYLYPRIKKVPFLVATGWWPLIDRKKWENSFRDNSTLAKLAENFLFEQETQFQNPLLKRLKYIYEKPPIRLGAQSPVALRDDDLERLAEAITPAARPAASQSEQNRLRTIEANVKKQTKRDLQPGDRKHLIYEGRPSTGKTFRLLEHAWRYAFEKQSSLFVCFNKTLAADLRRLISVYPKGMKVGQYVTVTDTFALASEYAHTFGLNLDTADGEYNRWGELIVQELKKKRVKGFDEYDLILLDESQDMPAWQIELALLHQGTTTSVCIAFGTGQELYLREQAECYVQSNLKPKYQQRQLRRVFRNTKPTFYFAYVLYEFWLQSDKATNWIRNKYQEFSPKELELDIARPEGSFPKLEYITTPGSYDSYHSSLIVEQYKTILLQELDHLKDEGDPLDLLVLVPDAKGSNYDWALQALREIQPKYQHIDLCKERNRRDVPDPETIRLCTFHSARGLEGLRVVVFGFEFCDSMSERLHISAKNLSYIILTRAVFETTIVMRGDISNRLTEFVCNILREFSEVDI